MITVQYVPTTEFLQAVNMDSLRVVAFIQDDNTQEIYQSTMHDINQNYMATMSTQDEYYFGASTGTANYTAYVKNIGLFPDTYNISLEFDGPAGWSQTFTTINGTFNLGETDTVTLNPGDSTDIQVSVSPNGINGYGRTTAQFISNWGSYDKAEFRFTTFGLDILEVDDDGGENYQDYFLNELMSISSDYGIITSDFIPANADSLNTYNIIIWNTGVTEPGISTDELNALAAFLDNGGRLYLNGVDIAYQMADPSSPYYSTETMNFFTNYLHSSYILREHSATIATGIAGDPITNGLGNLTLVGGTGANTIDHSAGHYPNQIAAEGMYSADILYFWLKPDEHPGIRANHGASGKVVFTTFGFETISQEEKRTLFAERIVEWLSNPVSVEDDQSGLPPASFNLYQNFPNPFNPVTTIKYQVSNTSPILIKVYDIIGREVSVLVNEVKEPGTYQVSFDSKNLASGIYFYKMVAGDFTSVKKMNLLK
jgi:archaellum component FlaG (FlaF/FlaG flagellin family)